MSKVQIKEIAVDDGTTLEILQHGADRPSVLLIAGIHGDEKTGPALLRRLSDRLVPPLVRGTVSLLPVTNPKAYDANKRDHPDDVCDLNRCFFGGVAPVDSPSGRLVAVMQRLIRQQDAVIDVHGFPRQLTPIVGVFLREGDEVLRQRSRELLEAFGPEAVWELDTQSDEPVKSGSACSYALAHGTPAFALELADPEYYSETEWSRMIQGLLRVLGTVGCLASALPEAACRIPRYEKRKVSRASVVGYFVPRKRLFESVAGGEVVGELVLQDGGSKLCRAEHAGVVFTIAPRGKLQIGQKLFATAAPVTP